MNRIQQTAATAKKFVVKHKTAITIIATATVCYKIHRVAVVQHNDFLAEHGLLEKFYNPDED